VTVQDIVNGAMRLIGVLGEGQTLTAAQNADAFEALNALVAAWAEEGLPVFPFASAATSVDDTGGLRRALRFNLALELAPEFGIQASGEVQGLAAQSKALIFRAIHAPRVPTVQIDSGLLSPSLGKYDINAG